MGCDGLEKGKWLYWDVGKEEGYANHILSFTLQLDAGIGVSKVTLGRSVTYRGSPKLYVTEADIAEAHGDWNQTEREGNIKHDDEQ